MMWSICLIAFFLGATNAAPLVEEGMYTIYFISRGKANFKNKDIMASKFKGHLKFIWA